MRITKHLLLLESAILLCSITLLSGCNFVRIDIPDEIVGTETVFKDDSIAIAAIRGIYSTMTEPGHFACGDQYSITYLAGVSSDELFWSDTFDPSTESFANNELLPSNAVAHKLWTSCYKTIYYANTVLEGIAASTGISTGTREQLEGEARFVRAFSYFYLVNLFGKVPLVLTTDYRISEALHRAEVNTVYTQLRDDLIVAAGLLKNYPNGRRTRPNALAAHALLARVYLYQREWARAEKQASLVINSGTYTLVNDVRSVFLANSHEAIWQLKPTLIALGINTWEAQIFSGNPVLNPTVMSWFEANDKRIAWTATVPGETVQGYAPNKYVVTYTPPGNEPEEYATVLRYAEQFLIRAEARVWLQNAPGAAADIDVIRARAGLPLFSVADPLPDDATLLAAVYQERRVEFLAEWAHRWFDLKRTGRVDAVMQAEIGDAWKATDALYPIPQTEITNDPNLAPQNDGY